MTGCHCWFGRPPRCSLKHKARVCHLPKSFLPCYSLWQLLLMSSEPLLWASIGFWGVNLNTPWSRPGALQVPEQLPISWLWLQSSQSSAGGARGLQWWNSSGAAWLGSKTAKMLVLFFWHHLCGNFPASFILFIDSLTLTVIIWEAPRGIAGVWRVTKSTSLGLSSKRRGRVIVWLSEIFI